MLKLKRSFNYAIADVVMQLAAKLANWICADAWTNYILNNAVDAGVCDNCQREVTYD